MSKYLIINVLGEPIVSAQKLPLSGSMRTQSDGIVSCRVPQVLCGLLFLAGAVRAQTPSVAVERPAGPVRVGRSCYVTYTVTWAGAADAYSVFPGQFDPVDWGRLALTHVVGAGTADGPQVVQTLEIIPEKTGEYTVPEIRFVYHPASQPPTPPEHPDSASHVSAPSAPPSLRADAFPLLVQPNRTLGWMTGGVGSFFVLLVLVCGGYYWYTRRWPRPGMAGISGPVDLESAVRRARQQMMDGQFYEFYCELERAARQLPSRAATLCELLAQRMQDVGYRGLRPDPNQMQSDLRLFERAVKQANEERTE